MITAITNTTSQNISGTTYYSDGCLYTTTYNSQVESTVPYISTVTGTGTYWTSSSKIQTLTTHLGNVTTNIVWSADTFKTNGPVWYFPSGLLTQASVTYHYTKSSSSFTLSDDDWVLVTSNTESHVFIDPYSGDFYFTRSSSNENTYWSDKWVSSTSVDNISIHATSGTDTYDVSFSDSNDFGSYTATGYSKYGFHSGSTYKIGTDVYSSFSYIRRYDTIEETYTVKDVYTTEGNITKSYTSAATTTTLYPNVTYTISSNFNGYCVSTSEKMVIDTFTQTITATTSFPSEVSGLSVQYYITGTCSTEMNFNQGKPRDRKYTTTNFFSVSNQRDKSYLISMAIRDCATAKDNYGNAGWIMEDETVYIILPHQEDYIRDRTATTSMYIQGAEGVEQKAVTTAYIAQDHWADWGTQDPNTPMYGLSIYEVEGWNTTSWKPVLGTIASGDEAAFNDTISGVTLGSQVFSTTTIPANEHKKKTDYIKWGWGSKSSWVNQRQTFQNISNAYVDTYTKKLEFNGFGVITQNYSFTVTTTYAGLSTHFVTGE